MMEGLTVLLCVLLTAKSVQSTESWTTETITSYPETTDWGWTSETITSYPETTDWGWTSGFCGGYMTDRTGEFFSPLYPNNYPNNALCTWTIHSTGQTTVLLTFTFVDLETCCDNIQVFDGPSSLFPLLGELRDNRRRSFNSTQSDVTVVFHSDHSVTRRGFRANWVFLDTNSCKYNCGNHLSTCSCDDSCQYSRTCCQDYNDYCLATTNWPWSTSDTADSCRYYCGFHLDTCSCDSSCQYYGNCCHDFYTYCSSSSWPDPTAGESFHCWDNCGIDYGYCSCESSCQYYGNCCYDFEWYCQVSTTSSTPMTSVFSTVDVYYSCWYNCGMDFGYCSCNSSCQYYGNCCYDFEWYCPLPTTSWPSTTDTHPECGGHLYGSGMFSSPNYPNYYHDNAYCVWYLSAQSGQRIFLSFADLQLERCCRCDYISVYDGPSTGYQQLGSVCFSNTTQQTFHSSSRYLTVVFRTDYSGVSHGFKALFTSSLTADQGRVDCSSDNMAIVIRTSYLNSLGFNGNDLYVDDHRCRPTITSTEVVFRFPLNTCGTGREIMNGYVTYINNVRATRSQSAEITRQSQFLLRVGCRMEPDTMVQILYKAKETVNANITGTGRFNASIAFYTSSSFYQQVYDSPFEVNLNQNMYVQVQLNRPDSSLDLFLDTCVASPDPNDFQTRSYDLLRNGCARDSTFYSYINGQQYYARFRFQAFKFLQTHAFVYLQCKVIICPDNDYNSRCRQGCRLRRKRSLETQYHTNTVILGPIKLKGEKSGVKQSEKRKEEK